MLFSVNNYDWIIQYEQGEMLTDHLLGLTNYIAQTISIRANTSAKMQRSTVIHELIHCFLFCYGAQQDAYNEEFVCNFIGAHMDDILKIADDFMTYEGEIDNA